eukprot:gb/GFBE01083286.1/.p1 GENE.gb/GFBE01083286.1/~~gb/GFBE01083286.1/.p1  ORF type:complete len:283 (+),score=43.72 gb/GFBE01083286.1/:1-849(+)
MSDVRDVLQLAFNKAVLSGVAGGVAQAANVFPLMWMRTIMEYQYKNGGRMLHVAKLLYAEGGIPRFYRGLTPALILAPTARFGDTATNELALASLSKTELPLAVKTMCASGTAAAFRVAILPLDAWKVNKQVHGKAGLERLLDKAKKHPAALWHGALGVLTAGALGHYPWFYTNNYLRESLPEFEMRYGKHLRNALIGFASAVVSDSICNPVRVLKVNRQTSLTKISYYDAAAAIINSEGVLGLWGRGLKTRIIANGIQGSLFTVLWKAMSETLARFVPASS